MANESSGTSQRRKSEPRAHEPARETATEIPEVHGGAWEAAAGDSSTEVESKL